MQCAPAAAAALVAAIACASLPTAGCSSVDDAVFDPSPDATPDGPPAPVSFRGAYVADEHWDLRDVVADEEGLGGVVADVLVDAAVELAGVPDALTDEARGLVADAVRAPARDFVNARLPADLVPDSPLLVQLGEVFADVEVDSVIGLAVTADPNALIGTEKVEAIALSHGDATIAVSIDDLLAGTGLRTIEVDFTGSVTGPRALRFDDHTLTVQLGALVELAASELLGRDDLAALSEQALAAVACADLVDSLLTGDELGFEVAGQSFAVDRGALVTACNLIEQVVEDRTLGLLDLDTPVAVGGAVALHDADADAFVERLTADAGYRGQVTLTGGLLVRDFDAAFVAPRQ